LLVLDFDVFDRVNRNLGLSAGDSFLCEAAWRLHALTSGWGSSCFLGRLGGDEFGSILWPVGEDREAASLADNIVNKVNQPVLIPSYEYPISVSIGITLCQQQIDTVETLLWRALQGSNFGKECRKEYILLCGLMAYSQYDWFRGCGTILSVNDRVPARNDALPFQSATGLRFARRSGASRSDSGSRNGTGSGSPSSSNYARR
jgi:diguanylate cyclase (GGDEF)-like protein